MVHLLDLRHDDVGGAVAAGHLYTVDGAHLYDADGPGLPAFTAATRDRELVVLLHGFNNTRFDGMRSLVRFARLLRARGVTAMLLAVLWPGDGWAKALTYPFEGKDADDSAEALVTWINHNVDGSAHISLVAHSLGSRVAMHTAQRLAEMQWAGVPRLARVCLMAAAIDSDCLGRVGPTCYRTGALATERIAVLASQEDRVLARAYPIGDLAQTILYFGERWGSALGLTGPDEDDPAIRAKLETVPRSDASRGVDHGHYLDVKTPSDTHTIAHADEFVAGFLTASAAPVWPATRP
ncbi:MAG: alpha/beta fold hydrolase [Candidatus Rokubacteria bacterium]|nr:alpha/beta fold hydrolase [Candidatus Rokubacteria bacterium]